MLVSLTMDFWRALFPLKVYHNVSQCSEREKPFTSIISMLSTRLFFLMIYEIFYATETCYMRECMQVPFYYSLMLVGSRKLISNWHQNPGCYVALLQSIFVIPYAKVFKYYFVMPK